MRVLMNAASAKRGGIVTYTQNLVSYLRERDIDVIVAAPPDFSCPEPTALLKVRAGDYAPFRRIAWEQLVWRQRVARIAPDVLFSSANFGMLYSPVPQVLLMREGGLFDHLYLSHIAPAQGVRVQAARHFRRRMMLLSTRHAQHVITPSRAMLDSLLNWNSSLANKSSVNHYGARPDLFSRPKRFRRWRGDGTLRLLYVSVYYPHKCPGVLCNAVEALQRDGIAAHATITMTLDELERTPGAALDRAIMKAAAASGALTLGQHPYDELPNLYAQNDVFVFPSVSETFGHPMVEAMAAGLPIIAADTAINREICGEGALYFEPFSMRDLLAKLRELDENPDLRLRVSAAGLKQVSSAFTWEDHVDRLIETFEAVRRKPGRRPRSAA